LFNAKHQIIGGVLALLKFPGLMRVGIKNNCVKFCCKKTNIQKSFRASPNNWLHLVSYSWKLQASTMTVVHKCR